MSNIDFYDDKNSIDINFKVIENKTVVAQIVFSEEELLKHLKEFDVIEEFIFFHLLSSLTKRLAQVQNEFTMSDLKINNLKKNKELDLLINQFLSSSQNSYTVDEENGNTSAYEIYVSDAIKLSSYVAHNYKDLFL